MWAEEISLDSIGHGVHRHVVSPVGLKTPAPVWLRAIGRCLGAIFQSSVSNEKKLIWIIAVVLLPLLGLILWYFLGPRSGRSS